jgi:hypothetical protein
MAIVSQLYISSLLDKSLNGKRPLSGKVTTVLANPYLVIWRGGLPNGFTGKKSE